VTARDVLDLVRTLVNPFLATHAGSATDAAVALRDIKARYDVFYAGHPSPPPSPPPPPTRIGTCLGGESASATFTAIYTDPAGHAFYGSSVVGGVGPTGATSDGPATALGLSYQLVGTSPAGHSIWGWRFADRHAAIQASEESILAALATIGGTRYRQVIPGDARTGQCEIYEAGDVAGPPPGPNYLRVGTSGPAGIPAYSMGSGLPLYARHDANPTLVHVALVLTGGTPL